MQGILYNSSHFDTNKHCHSDYLINITIQFNFDFKLVILQHVYIAWFLQYWDRELSHSFGNSRTVQVRVIIMDKKIKTPLSIVLSGYMLSLGFYFIWCFYFLYGKQYKVDNSIVLVLVLFAITMVYLFYIDSTALHHIEK